MSRTQEQKRNEEMKQIQIDIDNLEKLPVYQGYDFSDLRNATTQLISRIIVCKYKHTYTNSLSHLKSSYPVCNICNRSTLKVSEYEQIKSYVDCKGNSYVIEPQNGETWEFAIGSSKLPKKTQPISILCREHGVQTVKISDMKRGQNRMCSGCNASRYKVARGKDPVKWIEEMKLLHKNEDGTPKYDYSKTKYLNAHDKVIITCFEHGDFEQSPTSHRKGNGCADCGYGATKSKNQKGRDKVIESLKTKHVNADGTSVYNYDKMYIDPITGGDIYENTGQKACITCKFHDDFYQSADDHIRGRGCPVCAASEPEQKIWAMLKNSGIKFTFQKSFDGLISPIGGILKFDFYLNEKNVIIEYNGEQHYMPIEHWKGDNGLKKQMEYDAIKEKYCKDNNIIIYVLSYLDDIDTSLPELIKSIE